jgi:predicted DCC family thiol-disulfide oxidoreductase YuxK
MSAERGTYVVYDGDCPFCSHYAKLLRLRDAAGPVALINARDQHEVVGYVSARGVDLNDEMALVIDGKIFAGGDCLHRLALMSTGSGVFNALTARVFASPRISRLLYPILRTARNASLWILGRKPILLAKP